MTTNPSCLLDGFYALADVNADCRVIGSDVTRLVNFFRGLGLIAPCPDYLPAWLSPQDCPLEAPGGWPGCETPPVTGEELKGRIKSEQTNLKPKPILNGDRNFSPNE